MASANFKLPVIDFSEQLKPGTPEWESVRSQVFRALEFYGCFEAVFDKVSTEAKMAAFNAAKEFFDLPIETKVKNMNKMHYHGYAGLYPQAPYYEGMGFEYANDYENVDSYTTVLWPEGNPSFSKSVRTYTSQMSELDKIVRRMIAESLGVEEYVDEHINSAHYRFRFHKYTPPKTEEVVLGVHSDKNFLTILHQNEVDGLEFINREGEWVSYKPSSPDSYAVLIGESLYAWTNGRLHCAHHKVTISGDKERYSLGLFVVPNKGYYVKTPQDLVDEEHPLLFKPFDYFEFLPFFYSEAGEAERERSALRAYCGVYLVN